MNGILLLPSSILYVKFYQWYHEYVVYILYIISVIELQIQMLLFQPSVPDLFLWGSMVKADQYF